MRPGDYLAGVVGVIVMIGFVIGAGALTVALLNMLPTLLSTGVARQFVAIPIFVGLVGIFVLLAMLLINWRQLPRKNKP